MAEVSANKDTGLCGDVPLSAEIYSVDTLRISPASEAFSSGKLVLHDIGLGTDLKRESAVHASTVREIAGAESKQWSEYPVNYVGVMLSVVACTLFVNRLLNIIALLFDGYFRWKSIVNLENSIKLGRDRNYVAAVLFLPFCLVASRYRLYTADFMDGFDGGAYTILTAAVIVGFLLLRAVLISLVPHHKVNNDTYRTVNNAGADFFILAVTEILTVAGISTVFSMDDLIVRNMIYAMIVVNLLVFWLRKSQILSFRNNQLIAILYLCTLEILPLAILITSAVIL